MGGGVGLLNLSGYLLCCFFWGTGSIFIAGFGVKEKRFFLLKISLTHPETFRSTNNYFFKKSTNMLIWDKMKLINIEVQWSPMGLKDLAVLTG